MFNDELSLLFSNIVYKDAMLSQPTDWSSVNINNYTDENGFYEETNGFACKAYKKGNQIIVAFRGSDSPRDIILSDLPILLGQIPEKSLTYAENFYRAIKNNPLYSNCEISFTGHSLGGAIAQVLSAKLANEGEICKATTFNAPGMLTMLSQLGLSDQINYSNITNYAVMNDYVGNFRAHIGNTYYIQPIPIISNPLYDSHNGIFNYSENINGEIISKPVGFETAEALSLWYYDKNNDIRDLTWITSNITPIVSEESLKHALDIINTEIGAPTQILQYKTPQGEYILGTDDSETTTTAISGTNDFLWFLGGNDVIYANAGNDTINAKSGNDIIIGGQGNDTINGGDDNDIIIADYSNATISELQTQMI